MRPDPLAPKHFFAQLLDLRNTLIFDLCATPADFRPRPDWAVRSEGLASHLFYFCIRGTLDATVEEQAHTLKMGEGIWINAGAAFSLRSPDTSHTLISRFRLGLQTPEKRPILLNQPTLISGNIQDQWLELVKRESCLPDELPSGALRCALAGLIADAFLEQPSIKSRGNEGKLHKSQIRLLALWWQELPAHSRPTSADLAKQLSLSRDHTNRLFRKTFGFSAEHWLIQIRIRAAAQRLVETTQSISEVADDFGYNSLFYFSRQFSMIMGCSPSAWRQRPHH